MIKRLLLLTIIFFFFACAVEEKTEFSEEALKDMVLTTNGTKMTFREILYNNKGKTIFIDIWASWCKDCIIGFKNINKLQEEFPEVAFVYLSVDRGSVAWKRGIEKYNLIGKHYNLPKGQNDGDFVNFIDLCWIPRYMIIDKKGNIALYKATKVTDDRILEILRKTK